MDEKGVWSGGVGADGERSSKKLLFIGSFLCYLREHRGADGEQMRSGVDRRGAAGVRLKIVTSEE